MSANIMRDCCEVVWQQECVALKESYSDISFEVISQDYLAILAEKICALPIEYQSLLILYYLYGEEVQDLNELLGVEDSEAQLCYIHRLLSDLLCLERTWIASDMLKRACELAQEQMNEQLGLEQMSKHSYSAKFKRQLKELNIRCTGNRIYMVVLRKIAVCLALVLLCAALIPSVRAKAWEIIKEWVVESFPEFSIFTTPGQGVSEDVDWGDIRIGYVPEGFALVKKIEEDEIHVYTYQDSEESILSISFVKSNTSNRSYYDTEGAEVLKEMFNGRLVYIWETEERSYIIWNEAGIDYRISGNISMNELKKIAEAIKKK